MKVRFPRGLMKPLDTWKYIQNIVWKYGVIFCWIIEKFFVIHTCHFNRKLKIHTTFTFKEAVHLWVSFAHSTQNFTGNSMVANIFVKNVRLINGSHFKIRPPKVGVPFVTKRWVWEKKTPFSILAGPISSFFFLDSQIAPRL